MVKLKSPTSKSGLPSPFQSATAGLLRTPQCFGSSKPALFLDVLPASTTSGRGPSSSVSFPAPTLRYQFTLPDPEPSTRSSFPSPSQSAKHGPASPPSTITGLPLAVSFALDPNAGF